jgi:hypothetical protein
VTNAVFTPAGRRLAARGTAQQEHAVEVVRELDCARAGKLALRSQLPVLTTWRWRVLHRPPDGPRFMITDRGWMYVGQEDWPTHRLLLPMGPRVTIVGYLDDPRLPPHRPAFEEHLDLCQRVINYLNSPAWDGPYIDLLIAHPR